jgi:hypothetical protein
MLAGIINLRTTDFNSEIGRRDRVRIALVRDTYLPQVLRDDFLSENQGPILLAPLSPAQLGGVQGVNSLVDVPFAPVSDRKADIQ